MEQRRHCESRIFCFLASQPVATAGIVLGFCVRFEKGIGAHDFRLCVAIAVDVAARLEEDGT